MLHDLLTRRHRGRPRRRTVLVTGASSGIGREVALLLAERGAALGLVARRATDLDTLAAACLRRGSPRVVALATDVADGSAVDEALVRATAQLGPLDSVVHAAGVAAYGHFEEIPAEVYDRVVETNVLGTANVARSTLQHFDRHGTTGDLILLGSLVGRISAPYMSPYVTSKWAVHGLTRTLQAEQGRTGHRISLVEPGGVSTTIYDKAASYLGVQGKPPPPVDDAGKVARACVALLERPRRERSVGLLNPVISLGFRVAPALYDRLAPPLMRRLALAQDPVPDHPGNLFAPLAEPQAPSEQAERGVPVGGRSS